MSGIVNIQSKKEYLEACRLR